MRNTKQFDINIFDEEIDLPEELLKEQNVFLDQTLTQTQRAILQSEFLRKISLASKKWGQVCEENNDALNNFFREMGCEEFDCSKAGYDFQPFKAGMFWHMMGYLDGNYILNTPLEKREESRKDYQNRMEQNYLRSIGDTMLLQTGWDLAINAALLSDVMPNPRNNGSLYLLEHIIEDDNSLFFPSVTNGFQKRIVNDSFWQLLLTPARENHLASLERTLTIYFGDLDPMLVQDNVLRWSQSEEFGVGSLVSGTYGPDSFHGLSKRAIENYGVFVNKIVHGPMMYPEYFDPLIKPYVDAVNCKDEDGIKYFQEDERGKLLDLSCVKMMVDKKD